MATFIAFKWRKVARYFYLQSFIFILFLLFYSVFIIYLFNRPETYLSKEEKYLQNLYERNPTIVKFPDRNVSANLVKPSAKFLSELGNGFWICETGFLVLMIVLTFLEVYQAWKLRIQYFQELENYIEWCVLASSLLSMIFKDILHETNPKAATVRGFVALGICLAWLELIFIIGRYPFRGGHFSIMFYNIVKKLFRYVIAMFLMIAGHAFGFMVLNYGHDQDSFESPWKSLVMTLTMALGEYQFEDVYIAFGEDRTSRSFAMILLILLILFGTITMINLFIAVIISDLDNLKNDVFTQNLINMAQCSMLVEDLLPNFILKSMKMKESITVCVHQLCDSNKCIGQELPEDLQPILQQLQKIARQR